MYDRIDEVSGEMLTKLHINPNKTALGIDKFLNNIRELREEMRTLQIEHDLTNSYISRVDFRIDNHDPASYDDFYKINKIIVLLIADALGLNKNSWESKNPTKLKQTTVRAQDINHEVEYYDRWEKTGEMGLVRARLELRSKLLECQVKDIPNLIYKWRKILSSLLTQYANLQQKQNETLLQQWECIKKRNPTTTMSTFILQNADSIFTIRQLADLLEKIGAKDPRGTARQYSYRYKLEFVTPNELKKYIQKIRVELLNFIKKEG